ncbi:GNAT family N-acetyltransferase [Photobacterium sp. R1]
MDSKTLPAQKTARTRIDLSSDHVCFSRCRQRGIVFSEADEQHEAFIFALKKAAERNAVTRVFGWDDDLQYRLHQAEWQACKPNLMLFEGKVIGSVLLESIAVVSEDGKTVERFLHLSRFFLMPEWQGSGIGSAVLAGITMLADRFKLDCHLQYLQGNPVAALYHRFGFRVLAQDSQFVTMTRPPVYASERFAAFENMMG